MSFKEKLFLIFEMMAQDYEREVFRTHGWIARTPTRIRTTMMFIFFQSCALIILASFLIMFGRVIPPNLALGMMIPMVLFPLIFTIPGLLVLGSVMFKNMWSKMWQKIKEHK